MSGVYEEGIRNGSWQEGTDRAREGDKEIVLLQDAVGDENTLTATSKPFVTFALTLGGQYWYLDCMFWKTEA